MMREISSDDDLICILGIDPCDGPACVKWAGDTCDVAVDRSVLVSLTALQRMHDELLEALEELRNSVVSGRRAYMGDGHVYVSQISEKKIAQIKNVIDRARDRNNDE